MPVIFAPEASFLDLLPLWAGLAGNAIEKKTSPIAERMGETILSPRLTLRDDALRAGDPASRPFDDEGVPCRRRTLVESGVLRGLLLDLRSAAALGLASTGNGIKRELFTAGTEIQPNPWAVNWIVEPGDSSLEAMIAELDEGLLVTGGIGFHSGNYSQGAFSVQAVGLSRARRPSHRATRSHDAVRQHLHGFPPGSLAEPGGTEILHEHAKRRRRMRSVRAR